VLQLGPTHTRYSTIWPDMDPAHIHSSPSHLILIEDALQQHEARIAAAVTKARQMAANQEQALNKMASQIQWFTITKTQPTPLVGPLPPAPAPSSPWPAPECYPPKVAFAINQLTGRARPWGTAECKRWTLACGSFLGHTNLSPDEQDRRQRANLCLYCGQPDHYVSGCPSKAMAHQ